MSFEIVWIIFSHILTVSILCRNMASYYIVELGLSASCGNSDIACILEMGASIRFVLA